MSERLSDSPAADLVISLAAGLRDGLRPSIFLLSVALWLAAIAGCSLAVLLFFSRLWAGVETVAQASISLVRDWLPDLVHPLLHASVSPLAWLLLAALWLVAVLLTARILIELFLMRHISARIRRQYPQLRVAPEGRFRFNLLVQLLGPIALLPLLLVPLVGALAFFAGNGWLLARSLAQDALEEVAAPDEISRLLAANRVWLMLAGTLLSLVLLLPLLGWFAPGILGCSISHFACRRLQVQRQLGPALR